MSQPTPPVAPAMQPRAENLALIFQEAFTVIERLRTNRQRVSDAETFRGQMRGALKTAEQDGLRRGYNLEDIRVATFAVVAFLDESILNMQNPIFADWPRKPLQEELFGVHVAGEIFYRNAERLMGRNDSDALADLIEVHQLCLLLGFRGRYSLSSGMGEVRALIAQMEEKIRRIRGAIGPISPPIPQGGAVAARTSDGVLRALGWSAAVCWGLALMLFVVFLLLLHSGVGDLRSIAARVSL